MRNSANCIPYYILLVWEEELVRWTYEFGDYERPIVTAERNELIEGYQDIPRKFTRIKRICSCECGIDDLHAICQSEPMPRRK